MSYFTLFLGGALISYACMGAELVNVSSPAGTTPVTAERLVDDEEQYLQFAFRSDPGKQRVLLSSHYVTLEGSIVGFRSSSLGLMINPALTVTNTKIFPVPDKSYAIKWETIFDWEKASGPDSRPAPPLTISALSALNDKSVEISVKLKSGDIGVVTLRKCSPDEQGFLLIQSARIAEMSIPIFDQPRLLSSEEIGSQPPLHVSYASADEKPVRVWSRIYSAENDPATTVAKAIVDGRELTWIGPVPGGFAVLHGSLYGVTVKDRFNILIRPAIASEELQFALPKAPVDVQMLKKLEERFSGTLLKLEEHLNTELAPVRETIQIREVGRDNGALSISIGTLEPFSAQLNFTPSTEQGFLLTRGGKTNLNSRNVEQIRSAQQLSN